VALAILALAFTAAIAAMVMRANGPRGAATALPASLVLVDAGRATGTVVSPALFGVGVDLSAATYATFAGPDCGVLAGIGGATTLVRVGADTADDYDWLTDTYDNPRDPSTHGVDASHGCPPSRDRAAASVLRVLDRARALHARAMVVLNGETDDPQGAYRLVAVIARRYGRAFARALYWEIGNAPAQWQHFGIPLTARSAGEHINCSPDQYAALVTGYHAAIAGALGAPPRGTPAGEGWPRVVADAWITNATDQSWAGLVAAVDTRYYPYTTVGAGTGPANARDVARGVSSPPSGTISLDDQLSSLRASLDQYGGAGVRLFVGQWNIDAGASAVGPFYDSAGQAAFVAALLAHAVRDGVDMAAWAPPLYGFTGFSQQAPIVDGRPTPGFRVFGALRQLAGARVLRMTVPRGWDLDGLAARRQDGGVSIALVRTDGRGPIDVPFRLSGGPARPVRATLQTFSAVSDGAARTLLLDPRDARIAVPAPGVVIVTLPR